MIYVAIWEDISEKLNTDVSRWRRAVMVYPNLPNPSARAGYDTRSIFKQSLTGLNSEFSFS